MTYRVIQWATGGVGRASIEGIQSHLELELVGCWVHSAEKVGKDVGEICGMEPLGIKATNDVDALLDAATRHGAGRTRGAAIGVGRRNLGGQVFVAGLVVSGRFRGPIYRRGGGHAPGAYRDRPRGYGLADLGDRGAAFAAVGSP